MDKLADCFAAYVAAQARAGADVVQLFDSWVGALSPADYEEFVAPWSARILAARRRADDPLRHRHLDAAAGDGARGRRRDRPRLAHPARRRAGRSSATTAACRATSTRRCCSGRGSASRRPPATCSRAPPAGRATSSTSATACCPAPIPDQISRLARLVQALPSRAASTARSATRDASHGEARMTPGRIVVDRVSRTLPRLPEGAAHAEGRVRRARAARRARGLGAARRLADDRARRGGRARRAQRLRQVDAAAARLAGSSSRRRGAIEAGGRIASLLELGAGFHPDFTGRENVYLNGSIHGLSRARVREVMDEIVAFAELEQFIDLPVRTYSSGMYMRLGFSVAAHIQADVLLLDEVFAVGDEQFQRKCFGKIAEFKNRGGTIVFVSHDAQAVERLCDRAVLLRQGEVAFDGVDARGDRRLPAAARRPTRARRSSRRACASGAAARRASSRPQLLDDDGRRARAVRGRRAGRGRAASSRRSRRRRAARLARAARRRRRSCSARVDAGARAELGWNGGARRARAALPARPAAARRRPLPPARRAGRRRRRPRCCTRSTTRCGSSSSRRAPRRAPCSSTATGRCRRSAPAAPIRAAVSTRACPDWPQLMEIAPDLQFRHYTLARGAAAGRRVRAARGRRPRRGRDLLRPRRARLQPRAHGRPRRRGAARHALDRRARERPRDAARAA